MLFDGGVFLLITIILESIDALVKLLEIRKWLGTICFIHLNLNEEEILLLNHLSYYFRFISSLQDTLSALIYDTVYDTCPGMLPNIIQKGKKESKQQKKNETFQDKFVRRYTFITITTNELW